MPVITAVLKYPQKWSAGFSMNFLLFTYTFVPDCLFGMGWFPTGSDEILHAITPCSEFVEHIGAVESVGLSSLVALKAP